MANPTQYATVNTTGTANSLNTGGMSTYNSTSTIAMPGGYTTYQIPFSVDRNNFFASYWAKRDPNKIRLGVNVAPLSDELRHTLQRNTGVIVQVVIKGSPAFIANILEGDVILRLNSREVIDPQGFIEQLKPLSGQTVTLTAYRSGEMREFNVTLNP